MDDAPRLKIAYYPPRTLPESSKKVLVALSESIELTHGDLVINTGLAPRTVRYALKKLKERRLIIEKFNFRDARGVIYQKREMTEEEKKEENKKCIPLLRTR